MIYHPVEFQVTAIVHNGEKSTFSMGEFQIPCLQQKTLASYDDEELLAELKSRLFANTLDD